MPWVNTRPQVDPARDPSNKTPATDPTNKTPSIYKKDNPYTQESEKEAGTSGDGVTGVTDGVARYPV